MSARTDRLDELAAITVEEWHHMRRICCLSVPRALLALNVTADCVVRRHERMGVPVPPELLPLLGRPMRDVEALTDERRQVAA